MVMRELVESIIGIACLIASYSLLMPLMNFLRDITISLGAPAGNANFITYCALGFFILLLALCFAYPLMAAYKSTWDQGQGQTEYTRLR